MRSIERCNFEWPWVNWQNFQRHGASRGLSATAELLVVPGRANKTNRSTIKMFLNPHELASNTHHILFYDIYHSSLTGCLGQRNMSLVYLSGISQDMVT